MSQPGDRNFHIGTSNIMLPVPNKQSFPEAFKSASRLTYYASLFNSLEVNSSFYKIPQAKTVEKWTREVPADFRFTFKLHRDLTHDKSSMPDAALAKHFMNTINAAATHAACLLIQFPAGRTYNPAFLERLLKLVQQDNSGWNVCVEFRHDSWYRDNIFRLLETCEAAVVVHDKSPSIPFPASSWTDFAYLRYHGPKGDYKNAYEFETLEQNAARIGELMAAGKSVYAYFNNTIGNAVFDALTLQELVTGKVTFEL
jgi:uncharacterized protein YecE (DUF72 family)